LKIGIHLESLISQFRIKYETRPLCHFPNFRLSVPILLYTILSYSSKQPSNTPQLAHPRHQSRMGRKTVMDTTAARRISRASQNNPNVSPLLTKHPLYPFSSNVTSHKQPTLQPKLGIWVLISHSSPQSATSLTGFDVRATRAAESRIPESSPATDGAKRGEELEDGDRCVCEKGAWRGCGRRGCGFRRQ